MLTIDGSYGEGGGQLLRLAAALSAVTATPIDVVNVRAGREKPGLAAQHLTAVRAVARIAAGRLEGDALRSTRLRLVPGAVRAGCYRFDVGTAGSITLVLQALLPLLLGLNGASSVTVTGGTDVRQAPPLDYFRNVLLPLLARAGVHAECRLARRGSYPAGGGEVTLHVQPAPLRPLSLERRGRLQCIRGSAHVARLPASIAERMRDSALAQLPVESAAAAQVRLDALEREDSTGPGGAVVLWAECDEAVLGAGAVAERGVRAEALGERVGRELAQDLALGATVDVHAADQILVYLALLRQPAAFHARELSQHARTAIWLIQQFLPVRFEAQAHGALTRVSVAAR
ncbi:MAG TPA: RNA 3'-terminal phosphate cyclase [Burkholderiales bacterium]|nr:RNA 3'-terminal phosphate cyclase [Burkholderiales bacterium]